MHRNGPVLRYPGFPVTRLYEPISSVIIVTILATTGLGALLLCIPILALLTHHRRKLAEIKARQNVQIAEETRAALEALRREMQALRDTTTEYDMSFDTALRRLEGRVENVELRLRKVEGAPQTTQQINRT